VIAVPLFKSLRQIKELGDIAEVVNDQIKGLFGKIIKKLILGDIDERREQRSTGSS